MEVIEQIEEQYIFKLSDFEGPLDLLLHMVKEAKIEIKNIFMSDITEQFLELMNQLETIDMDKAAEFVDVASTLLEIKVKALLPKLDEFMPPEEEDSKERLIRQLEEYNMLKEAGEKLKQQETLNMFFKAPDAKASDFKMVLKSMTLNNMIDAFSGMLHKIQTEQSLTIPKKIVKERFTVSDRMNYIKDTLAENKKMAFSDLFLMDFSKVEKINTFLALLELLKINIVTCTQDGIYGDIILEYIEVVEDGH